MFRRLPASLPKEAVFPAKLDKLGYYLNEDSQLRRLDKPTEMFRYFITNNERYNDMQREAMHECLRREVLKRMVELGIPPLYLPHLTTSKPKTPHVPIFCTPQPALRAKKRVVVVVNDATQDIGIWAWRIVVSINGGLEAGSCLAFVREIQKRAKSSGNDEPGVVILNPGQIWYSWKKKKALTDESWRLLPRSSLMHPRTQPDQQWNTVEGSRNPDEHVAFVFEHILANADWVAQDAELYVISNYTGGLSLLNYLDANFSAHSHHLFALSLVCPFVDRSIVTNPDLTHFLRTRSQAIIYAGAPAGSCLGAPYHEPVPNAHGYAEPAPLWPELASGPLENHGYSPRAATQEVVLPNVYPMILNWFEDVAARIEDAGAYENPLFELFDLSRLEVNDQQQVEGDTETTTQEMENEQLPQLSGIAAVGDDRGSRDVKKQDDSGAVEQDETAHAETRADLDAVTVGGVKIPKKLMEEAGLFGDD